MLLAGIDLGTTNIKAIAATPEGEIVASAVSPTPIEHPRPGWGQHDAGQIIETFHAVLRDLTARLPRPGEIAAVATASMGEAGFPFDASGRIIGPAIAWFDARTEPQKRWWEEVFGAERLFTLTGLPAHPMYTMNKLMWLKAHEPELFGRIVAWRCMEDMAIWLLCGEWATSPSIACRTQGFDVARRAWSSELFEAAGVPVSIMPPVYESGTPVGRVSEEASRKTGLPAGAMVATAGHDHLCGALAAGITRPGMLLDSSGTTESFVFALEELTLSRDLWKSGFGCECHTVPGQYALLGSVISSGVVVDWVKSLTGYSDYETFIQEAAAVAPGSDGVAVVPHFRGRGTPEKDALARGLIFGLTGSHTRAHLARAAMEGIAYEMKASVDAVEAYSGVGVKGVRAIGGGSRNDLWLQIKADVCNKPVEALATSEGTALGAAMLSGIAAGVYRDADDAARNIRSRASFEPEVGRHAIYEAIYRDIFEPLYPATVALSHRVSERFQP
ncbi:MAG: hypothetical protein IT210_24085 [Armatimonadetes bacterium]|nr:hypothetical protein [Armatimonadota bacterium]